MTVLLKITINGRSTFLEVTKKPIILGRADTSSFAVKDPRCSSTHCEVRLDNGITVIKDLGSKNGTFINESIIKESAFHLDEEGRIGDTKFILDSSKMTPEEIDCHTTVVRHKTQMIDLNSVGLDRPTRKAEQAVVHSAKSVEEAKAHQSDDDSTKTSLFKKIIGKIKS